MDKRDLAFVALQSLGRGLQRHCITVNSHKTTCRELLADLQRMSRSTKRSVQIYAVRMNIERLHALPQKHGLVYKFHQKPSSSITAARFSGVSVSRSSAS